jgi:MFS family permease
MKHNRKIIYLAGFLFSIPIALTSYINSSFLEGYINAYYVSILYVLSSVLTIIGMLQMEKILLRLGNRRATLWFSIILFFSLLLLAIGTNQLIIIPAFVLYWISASFIIATLDIFVEDFSKNSAIGRFRGFYLSIINVAWVLAQMLSGSIIAKSSFQGIYLISAMFMLLVVLIFVFFFHNFIDPKYKRVSIAKTIRLFIRNRNISKIYFIDLIIKFFYAWMVIYTPIYLNEYLGFSWGQIGFIFTIMLVPFVVLSFPLGKLSDKIGEKKIMITGFLIMSLSTLAIPLITQSKVWLWVLILLCTRIGAAAAEAMAESYFFKVISEEDADEISFFRNISPVAYIIAPLLAIPVLFFIPSFKYLFFVLGAILLSAFFLSLRLKDVK